MTRSRVPHILLLYWIIKIASTTLGETGADMFSMTFEIGYGSTILIFLALFILLASVKIAMKRYDPALYWLTFTASAIAGTAISDFIDRTLGLGYAAGSMLLLVLLAGVLLLWRAQTRSLSVEQISSVPAETYYWLAFLIANTLGTAAGDFLADDLQIGFMYSALLIGGVLTLTALLHYVTTLSPILLFWIAFILTRPFGATFGDLLTKSADDGGVAFGTIGASLVFTLMLGIALFFEIRRERAYIPEERA
ncbi:hypothetical protein LOH54_08330 [Sulfurimonas sp. HSL-3221]|uniref:COG4705 family protein n=1 Tax=Sulfurimonadaceae TaxID=2771471 RepID=UPI001E63D911|nr:hypothetical protein [Sulfurimonas sp. HSL-3221]UFS61669.1 hypothetical protein LOH54_08330 [Sulfurimonas sp. HSL-3221]